MVLADKTGAAAGLAVQDVLALLAVCVITAGHAVREGFTRPGPWVPGPGPQVRDPGDPGRTDPGPGTGRPLSGKV